MLYLSFLLLLTLLKMGICCGKLKSCQEAPQVVARQELVVARQKLVVARQAQRVVARQKLVVTRQELVVARQAQWVVARQKHAERMNILTNLVAQIDANSKNLQQQQQNLLLLQQKQLVALQQKQQNQQTHLVALQQALTQVAPSQEEDDALSQYDLEYEPEVVDDELDKLMRDALSQEEYDALSQYGLEIELTNLMSGGAQSLPFNELINSTKV